MSAIIISKTDTAIEMLADGVSYSDDGVVGSVERKIAVWEDHGVAVATRGDTRLGAELWFAFASVIEHYDLYGAVKALSEIVNGMADEFAAASVVEMTIVGWQGSQPQCWHMVTHDLGEQVGLAFYPIAGRYHGGALGSPSEQTWEALGITEGAPDDTLRTNSRKLMEAFRHMPGAVYGRPDLPPVYGVGGHIQYVRLEPDGGCEDVILHKWPDVPGEKIMPWGEA